MLQIKQPEMYQKVVSQPEPPKKWYSGAQPTSGEVMAQIYRIGQQDKKKADQLFQSFNFSRTQPGTMWYNPYELPTNKAIQGLADLGFDMSQGITTDWLNQNAGLMQYARQSVNGYGAMAPTKKSSDAEKAAYWWYQAANAEEKTQKAENEWKALQEEINYWTQRTDLNLSDDEILGKINWKNYSTLVAMDEGKAKQNPLILNRAVGYSQDALKGVIWASRNNGGTGDNQRDCIFQALGQGNTWAENKELKDKRNKDSDAFSPYSVGAVGMDEAGLYFGVQQFGPDWLEQNEDILDGDDATAKKYYKQVKKAEKDTLQAEEELEALWSEIEKRFRGGKLKTADDILAGLLAGKTMLGKMNDSFENGELVSTTRPIDFKLADIKARVQKMLDDREAIMDSMGTVTGAGNALKVNIIHTQTEAETIAARNLNVDALAPAVFEAGTKEEQMVFDHARGSGYKNALRNFNAMKDMNSVESVRENAYMYIRGSADKYAADHYLSAKSVLDQEAERQKTIADSQAGLERIERMKKMDEMLTQYEEGGGIYQPEKMINVGGIPYKAKAIFNIKTGKFQLSSMEEMPVSEDQAKSIAESLSSGWLAKLNENTGPYEDENGDILLGESLQEKPQYQVAMAKIGDQYYSVIASYQGGQYVIDRIVKGRDENVKYTVAPIFTPVSGADIQAAGEEFLSTLPDMSEYTDIFGYVRHLYPEDIERMEAEEYNYNSDIIYASDESEREADNIRDAEKEMRLIDARYKMAQHIAGLNGIPASSVGDILPVLEYAAGIKTTNAPPAYSIYDYALQEASKEMDAGEAYQKVVSDAKEGRAECETEIKAIQGILERLEKSGVQDTNIIGNLQYMMDYYRHQIEDIDYFCMRGNEDFSDVVKRTREDLESKKGYWAVPGSDVTMVDRDAVDPDYARRSGDEMSLMAELSQEERDTYLYLLGNPQYGRKEAEKYYHHLTDEDYGIAQSRKMENLQDRAQQFAGKHPVLASLADVIMSPASAVGLGYSIYQWIIGEDPKTNSDFFGPMVATQAIEQTVKTGITEKFGKGSAGDILGNLGYDVIMSIAKSQLNAGIMGGASGLTSNPIINEIIGASGMAFGAAGNEIRETYLNGGDRTQAMLMAGVAFIAETVTEGVTYGNIMDVLGKAGSEAPFDTLKGLFIGILKDSLEEGVGESLSETISTIGDQLIMGELSQIEQAAAAYEQTEKISHEEALNKAKNDAIRNILYAGLCGAISGMGSTAMAQLATGQTMAAARAQVYAMQTGAPASKIVDAWNRQAQGREWVMNNREANENQPAEQNTNQTADPYKAAEQEWLDGLNAEENKTKKTQSVLIKKGDTYYRAVANLGKDGKYTLSKNSGEDQTQQAESLIKNGKVPVIEIKATQEELNAQIEQREQKQKSLEPIKGEAQRWANSLNQQEGEKPKIQSVIIQDGDSYYRASATLGEDGQYTFNGNVAEEKAESARDMIDHANVPVIQIETQGPQEMQGPPVPGGLEQTRAELVEEQIPQPEPQLTPEQEEAILKRKADIDKGTKMITSLSVAEAGDATSQTAAIAASLMYAQGERAESVATAAAVHLSETFGGDAAIPMVQTMLIRGLEMGMPEQMSMALTTAALGGGVSSQMLQSFTNPANITTENVQRFIEAASQDAQNPTVMQNMQQIIADNRVAQEVREIAGDGAGAAVEPYQQALARAQANQQQAESLLNTAQQNLRTAQDWVNEVGNRFEADYANTDLMSQYDAALEKMKNQQAVVHEYEQKLANAQAQTVQAQQDLARVNTDTMNTVRQQAVQRVAEAQQALAQQEQAEAEAKTQAEAMARAEEEQRAAAAEAKQENRNVARMAADSFIERVLGGDVTEKERAKIYDKFDKAQEARLADKAKRRDTFIKQVSNKYGVGIVFEDGAKTNNKYNGFYDKKTGKIHLNSNATVGDAIYFVLGHELTHVAEKSGTYGDLATAMLQMRYGKQIGNYQDLIKNIESGKERSRIAMDVIARQAEYNSKLADMKKEDASIDDTPLSVEEAAQEIIADMMGEVLSRNQGAVDALVKDNPTVARRILDAIKSFLRKLVGIDGVWKDEYVQAAEMLETALKDAGQMKEGQDKKKYSIEQDTSQREAETIVSSESGEPLVSELPGGTITSEKDYSLSSWTEREKKAVMKTLLKHGFTQDEITKWMNDIDSVGAVIAADRERLDFKADRSQKFRKPNGDVYRWTLDASSLCKKRLLYQGTFNAIQKLLPNTPLRPGDLIDLVNMMHEMGYQTPCGICYVESRRRHTGNAIEEFLSTYEGEYKPNYAELANTDGLSKLREEHPQAYKDFIKAMNKRGAGSIKLVQLRTDYRGDVRRLKPATIEYLNAIGGLRIQSFSDFETPHLMDMMQAVLDMTAVGLTSQAYTKVPDFAWVFGDTGIKINLSLMGEGTGVDENGNLIFSDTEGMKFEDAMKLRDRYSKNVGTILVGMNDAHILAAMADDRIDFIIPFHKSGWSQEELNKMETLRNYQDYEAWQNERTIEGYTKEGEPIYKNVKNNIEPKEYWQYGKTGKENAEAYLKMCAERGIIPKFNQFLVDNGDGSFSLQPDGSTDGYWKTLIDFKMYDNNGVGVPQEAVKPNINMEEAMRVLGEYEGGADTLPTAQPVVERFVEEFKQKHPQTKYSLPAFSEPAQTDPNFLDADNKPATNDAIEKSDITVKYSLRMEDPPKKTIVCYKAFYARDGKLYPPMVSNNTDEENLQKVSKATSGTMKGLETPVGVWLNADVGGLAVDENGEPIRTKTTNRLQVKNDKSGGKATLAFRPGWHLGEWPDATQFNRTDPVTGEAKSVLPDDLVFARCEISADIDYQLEALELGVTEKGGFNRTQAGLPRVPVDGFYKYRTNANPKEAPWYIAGAMRVTDILDDNDCREICAQFGITPGERYSHHDIDLSEFGLKRGPVTPTENLERFEKNKASYDNDALLDRALNDERYSGAYTRRALNFDDPTLQHEFEIDRVSPEQVEAYRTGYHFDDQAGKKYSLPNAAEMDRNYRQAVDTGDMETAQKLVDQAAQAAGYDTGYLFWRGDSGAYNELEPGDGGNLGRGLYFTQSRPYAERFARGGVLRKFYLKRENGADITSGKGLEDFREFQSQWLEDNGYDPEDAYIDGDVMSEILDDYIAEHDFDYLEGTNVGGLSYGASETAVQESWQAKLADPVTYDDDGNVIPLSERFNTQSPDIRYSLPSDRELDMMIQNYLARGGVPGENEQPFWKQRQFGSQTAQRSNALHDDVKQYLRTHSDYEPDSNPFQIERAMDWVQSHASEGDPTGMYGAVEEASADDFNPMSADGQARMLTLMSMAALTDNTDLELKLADAYNKQGTSIGQALQARKIFNLMTPLGRIGLLGKEVDRLNQQLLAQGKPGEVELSPDILKEAGEAKTQEDFDRVRRKAYQQMSQQLPVSWKDRLLSWRMLSMLGNPRTHIRNLLGNAVFMPAVKLKNVIGTGLESALLKSDEEHTKVLKTSKESRAFAKADAIAMKDTMTGEAKMNPDQKAWRDRKIFGQGKGPVSKTVGKALQALSDFNSWALEAEDWIFLKKHYTNAMASYMDANGLTAADMTGGNLAKAREYAISEAQKATYRDASEIANTLGKISRKGGVAGFLVDAALPFKKTPANILKRGIEYSPVGLIRTMMTARRALAQYQAYQEGKLDSLPKGAKSPTQIIDGLAAGLSGSLICGLGAALAALGWVNAGLPDDDDREKDKGKQEYAMNFNLLGHDISYTIDWAAPICMPFFVGATMYENLMQDRSDMSIGEIIESFSEIADPVFNLSMLDGVNSLLSVNSYSGQAPLGQIMTRIAANYAGSYVPTLAGQISRTIDPVRRKNFVPSGTPLSEFAYALEKAENKLPLSVNNIPYRNHWGEEERDSVWVAAFENLLSPGYISEVKETELDKELSRLYDATGEKGVLQKLPEKTVTVNGETIRLTAEQYDELTRRRGQESKQLLESLMNQPEWDALSDGDKVKLLDYARTYVRQTINADMFGGKMDAWVANAQARNNPVDAIYKKHQDGVASAMKSGYREAIWKAYDSMDFESADTAIEGLRVAGTDDGDIKSEITKHFKPIYQQAYEDDDNLTMFQIEDFLLALNLKNRYKKDTFNDWIKAIK